MSAFPVMAEHNSHFSHLESATRTVISLLARSTKFLQARSLIIGELANQYYSPDKTALVSS